jgi:pSer/pThr/pTyr-binding forkhead associated (FHA) protein
VEILVYHNNKQVGKKALPARRGKTFTIGQGENCELVLPSNGIDKCHAIVYTMQDGSYQLVDNFSKNGTFVNGQKITQRELNFGDLCTIGKFTIVAVCDHIANEIPKNEEQQTSKGEIVKQNSYGWLIFLICLGYGFFGGMSMFWLKGFFLILGAIIMIVLYFWPEWFKLWQLIFTAAMHGVGIGVMTSIGAHTIAPIVVGVLVACISGLMYIIPWSKGREKQQRDAATTNIKR